MSPVWLTGSNGRPWRTDMCGTVCIHHHNKVGQLSEVSEDIKMECPQKIYFIISSRVESCGRKQFSMVALVRKEHLGGTKM